MFEGLHAIFLMIHNTAVGIVFKLNRFVVHGALVFPIAQAVASPCSLVDVRLPGCIKHVAGDLDRFGVSVPRGVDNDGHKKTVFENTNDVQIAIDNLTIIDYPEEENYVKYVEFTQTYNSDLLKQTSQKKQIWRKFNNEWKIISESTH